jgi:ABC-type polar amino acid transport system ATPase subunit
MGITRAISSQDMYFVKMVYDRIYLVENGQIVECFAKETNNEFKENSKIGKFMFD